MREFKNKRESIYLNEEDYYFKENMFLNSENKYHNNDYYDYSKLIFNSEDEEEVVDNQIHISSDELNVDSYIKHFIKEFNNVFKDFYSEETLYKILNQNLKTIKRKNIINESLTNESGNYDYEAKTITLMNDSEEVLFHEFVHALRGNEQILDLNLLGPVEGFTSYAEYIYMVSKRKNYIYSKDNINYFNVKNQMKNKLAFKSYLPLHSIVQQLEYLHTFVNDEQSLLEVFLKRGNIYKEINKIFKLYYFYLNEEANNKYTMEEINYFSMKTTYDMLLDMDDMLDNIKIYNTDDNLDSICKDIMKIYNRIEKQISEIGSKFSMKKNMNVRFFNQLLINHKVRTPEERLLRMLFEEKKEDLKNIDDKVKELKIKEQYYENHPKFY